MPFLEKRNNTKKSKLARKKKINKKPTRDVQVDEETEITEISSMMSSQNLHGDDGDENKSSSEEFQRTTQSSASEEGQSELQKVQEENQYLRLLLGVSHKVDQLYEIWNGHFPSAFTNQNTLRTYLELHSKQKQSELILKTFEHVERMKYMLNEHKCQMLGGASVPVTTSASSARSGDQTTNVSESAVSVVSQGSELRPGPGQSSGDAPLIESHLSSNSSGTQPSASEASLTTKQRVDLGRMMSNKGPILLNLMCHCKGMCVKGCVCRAEGQNCTVRCGCAREKCQSRNIVKAAAAVESTVSVGDEEDFLEEADKENQDQARFRVPNTASIAPALKHKRLVAPAVAAVREEPDLEMSPATQRILERTRRAARMRGLQTVNTGPVPAALSPAAAADTTVAGDCSVLGPSCQAAAGSLFSTPAFQRIRTNQIRGGTSSQQSQ